MAVAQMDRQEVFAKVKQALVDALSCDDDDVREEATLKGDLGAESIDMLDINFRLEKAFGIKIPQSELVPTEILGNAEYVSNKRLNAAGLAALRARMPYADLSAFEKDPDVDKILDHFTVGMLVSFVQSKIGGG